MKQYTLSGVIGGVGFIIIYLIGKNVFVSLPCGLLIYYIFTNFILKPEDDKIVVLKENYENDYNYVVSKGYFELEKIKNRKNRIDNEEILNYLDSIIKKTDKIFKFISKNNSRFEEVRSFTEYYLPTINNILDNYISICNDNIESEESQDFKNKIGSFLDEIDSAFTNQLNALHNNQMLDAKVEMETIKSTLKSEGLIDYMGTEKGGANND